jgi:integrase
VAGHIQQRGQNTWRLHAFLGLDQDGRKRYRSKTFHGTKREAEVALAAFVTEVSRDRTAQLVAHKTTVSEVLAAWLEARGPHLAPSTVDRYRVAIKHVVPVLGPTPVSKLRSHHIEDFYNRLVKAGQSGSSIRKIHWAMRQALAWAHKRGLTAIVATTDVELPPLGAREIDPPETASVRKVVDHALATRPEWGALIALIAWTGCRRGEACGLRWDDVDLAGGSILIRRAVVAVPGGSLEKGTKTGEVRRLAIGPRLVELLEEHLNRCRDQAGQCGATIEPNAFVFSPDVANRVAYNPHTITNTFGKLCRAAGIPRLRLHDLRHHSATTLLKNGSSVGEVMDRHGWKTVEMVNRYRHLLEATDREAAVALENM